MTNLQVRDLIEQLKTYPPDAPLRFVVECVDSTFVPAEDYTARRGADGVQELCILGASVRQHSAAPVENES